MNHASMKKVLHWILTGWIIALGTGCSGFHRAWRQEATTNPGYPPSMIEGAWEGEWISDSNGHHGRLRCLLTENEDGTYTTWYHAKYLKFLSFAYAVEVNSNPTDKGYSLSGEADLGKLAGGMYHYEGTISDGHFKASYESKYDDGTFRMTRPLTDP